MPLNPSMFRQGMIFNGIIERAKTKPFNRLFDTHRMTIRGVDMASDSIQVCAIKFYYVYSFVGGLNPDQNKKKYIISSRQTIFEGVFSSGLSREFFSKGFLGNDFFEDEKNWFGDTVKNKLYGPHREHYTHNDCILKVTSHKFNSSGKVKGSLFYHFRKSDVQEFIQTEA